MQEHDDPAEAARHIIPKVIGIALIAVIVVGVVSAFVLQGGKPEITGLGPATPPPFGADAKLVAGPAKAWYSPDGSKLAVITAGAVGLASEGQVRRITPRGGNVVDVAWFQAGTALLVAEGPIPTGGLAVVNVTGEVRGSIALDPPVTFGDGFGMSVAPGGKRAIVTAVERDTFGKTHTYLVSVDLTTGKTSPLGQRDDQARNPEFVDANRLAFTRLTSEGRVAVVRSLVTQDEVVLGDGAVVGVIGDGQSVAVDTGDSLVSYLPEGGGLHVLAAAVDGGVQAVHPSGVRAAVAATESNAVVLREISLVRRGST
ncbi:MAG: hypothetical protein ACR2H3_05200 [Acidimicrobiales bacterium]